jgi:[NiFe] hydrogenase diaphorase moiety large subunit
MSQDAKKIISDICSKYGNDRTRLMDILGEIQAGLLCVDSSSAEAVAGALGIHRIDVESVVSFYAFFSSEPKGKVIIRVCDDVVDKMYGAEKIAGVFSSELGIKIGETSKDGMFTLEYTPCVGMSDQPPAAIINDTVVTALTEQKAKEIVSQLKNNPDPKKLKLKTGDGNNADPLISSEIKNNIMKKGEVIFAERKPDEGLRKALSLSPDDVIKEIKTSKLRGRGGAGFPTGLKWEFTRGAGGDKKAVICNADEGEPGTFKDRVILTELPDMLFEGMTVAGYAIGAQLGILYLRGEYKYLKDFLQRKLDERKKNNLLGKKVLGKDGFDFDIKLRLGAGAYICGEETALISSCEGLRGDPKTRPPFPAQKGYLGMPTTVNNVETFCCAARVAEGGGAWFSSLGSSCSSGSKLLSVSGDCERPGVYEFPFGARIEDILKEAGAKDAKAVVIGGPSGQLIDSSQFGRTICYDDLATGGAFVVFGKDRDIFRIVDYYLSFFIEESCGYCTPCRAGNVILKNTFNKIMDGNGELSDIPYMEELAATMKNTSRCGLGQTSGNMVLGTIRHFRNIYEDKIKERKDGFQPSFDIAKAVKESEEITGRKSVMFEH